MSFLEIVGFIAVWIVGTYLVILAAMWLISRRHGGLEIMANMVIAAIAIIGVSATTGLILLGRMLA